MKVRILLVVAVVVAITTALYWFRPHSGRAPGHLSAAQAFSSPSPAAGKKPAGPHPPSAITNTPTGTEFDLNRNPYAGALREPGKAKRSWDPGFLTQFQNAAAGDPI